MRKSKGFFVGGSAIYSAAFVAATGAQGRTEGFAKFAIATVSVL